MYLFVTVVSDTPVSKHLKHNEVNYSYALSLSQASIEKHDVFTGKKRTFERVKKRIFLRETSELMKINVFELVFLQKQTMVFKALRCALFTLKSFVFLVVCLPGQRAICKLR